MAFNVLKDPKDPRNFIVQPVPQAGIDPLLLEAGELAGQAGTLQRPATPGISGPTAPGTGETQFGQGSAEAFAQGLFNFQGRLNRKRFEQNKRVFEANLVRDGLNINAPGVRGALNEAYQSTNSFQAASAVAQDFFFNQPEQQAQRAVDLKVLQDKEALTAKTQRLTNQKLVNDNEIFKVTLGVPMQLYTSDKQDYLENVRLADRVRDLQTISERWGAMRGPTFTDAERAAVATAYDDATLQLTIAVSQANQAGALSDAEFERFSRFLPGFGTLSSLQDSTRRVTLGNAFNIFQGSANDLVGGNRGLQKGSESVNFERDIGAPKTWQEILFIEADRPGDIRLTPEQLEERRRTPTGAVPTPAELGGPDLSQQFLPGSEVSEPGQPAADIGEFFGGLGDIIGEGGQPMTAERRAEAVGLIGASVGAAAETARRTGAAFQEATTDEEERARLRRAAGR